MSTHVNPNYRVEHVAPVPQGWHVRTKMSATHMLRIAFPPGRRRRGAGKVVEIFHPLNENPCAMQRNLFGFGRSKRETYAVGDLVKVHFHKGSEGERIWVKITGRRGRKWIGTLDNEPVVINKSYGDTVSFSGRQILEKNPDTYAQKRQTRERAARIRSARLSNPTATESAAALYESFHGKSPREILEMQESDAARHTYTALGDLRELVIDARTGTIKIGFDASDAVKVASAPGGKQIYLLGGNQNLDAQLARFGSDPGKDFVELGAVTQITYRARKSVDNFSLVDYYHDLGEETNEPPFAFYDRLKRRIFLAGGRYRVEAPGIIN